MPHATRDDLVDALFSDGISTREEITDISGRGVGLAAVKDACQAAQGVLQVTTAKDQGTTFSFRFPIFVSEVSSPNDDSRVEPSLRIQPTNPN